VGESPRSTLSYYSRRSRRYGLLFKF